MSAPPVILDTLAQYSVTVDHEIRQNEIAFWIDDKRLTWRYDPVRPDVTDLRLKLQNFGALPKVSASTNPISPPPEPTTEAPEPTPAPAPSQTTRLSSPVTSQTGYTVFRSAKVIAIELSEDLRIAKGHMLVIPLNRPNALLDMTREQFIVLFDATEENPTEVEPIRTASPTPRPSPRPAPAVAPERNDENDIMAYLLQRKGGVKVRVIADALGMTLKMTDTVLKRLLTRGTVELEDGFWHLTARGPVPKKVAPAKKTRRMYAPRSPSGLPAQVGRMLAAMAYLFKAGKADVSTQDVLPLLIPRDKTQFSARMPGAIDRGWVQKGPALPPPATRGWFYKITPLGIAAIKAAGNMPFEEDGETTPVWLATL